MSFAVESLAACCSSAAEAQALNASASATKTLILTMKIFIFQRRGSSASYADAGMEGATEENPEDGGDERVRQEIEPVTESTLSSTSEEFSDPTSTDGGSTD